MRIALLVSVVVAPVALACQFGGSSVEGSAPPSVAASSPASPASPASPTATPCRALCSREGACDSRFPGDEECLRICNEKYVFSKLRDDAEALFTACLADRSCQSVLADDAVNGCFESLVDAPLTGAPSAPSVCDELSASLDECPERIDLSECAVRVRVYDDATVEKGRQCVKNGCSTRSSCINEVFALVRVRG